MKKLKKNTIALTMGSILAGSGIYAFAQDNKTLNVQPFEGLIVEDVVTLEQLPTEVQHGLIKVGDSNEQTMTKMAKLSVFDAIQIANKAAPGKVVELQLDKENGFLIWEVSKIAEDGQEVQLKLDAGNGRLLAAETGDHHDEKDDDDEHEERNEGKHSSWKFWEDNDKDEKD